MNFRLSLLFLFTTALHLATTGSEERWGTRSPVMKVIPGRPIPGLVPKIPPVGLGWNRRFWKRPSNYTFDTFKTVDTSKCTIKPIGKRSTLGEGPFWDEDKELLFWVDMPNLLLNSYNPETDKHVSVKVDSTLKPLSLVVKVKGTEDKYLIALKGALAIVQWNGVSTRPLKPKYIIDVEPRNSTVVLNEGKVDCAGRFWVGSKGAQLTANPNTFEKDKGSLFRIEGDGKVTKVIGAIQISNGLDWSKKCDKFYYVDSLAYQIDQYDFNKKTGDVENRKIIFDLEKRGMVSALNSLPDGLIVDNDDKIILAVYGTQKVVRIDPSTGDLLNEIVLPTALEITSVAFGGEDLTSLYVTTARVDWSDELEKKYPESGYLFKVDCPGLKGRPSREVEFDEDYLKRIL